MEINLVRLKQLIEQREQIDDEIIATVGTMPAIRRKALSCSICHVDGHTARTCPQKVTSGN